jgi:RNA polymerase sigma factor for flagellar operon FliA
VLDELRRRDWVPRSSRGKDNKLDEALWALQKSLERAPTEEEVASHLGITLDEYYRMIDDARSVSLISVEDLPADYIDRYAADGLMVKTEQGDALETLMGVECRKRLKDAIDALPEKERLVLTLYYYEELTMKEIGRVLDLTESRVCQLHAQATLRLRGQVKDLR